MAEFQIKKSDFTQVRVVNTPELSGSELEENQILVAVEKFAYTTNNITYAIAGERLGYWKFFPPTNKDSAWVVTPVWGFAKVIQSRHPKIQINERLYGYFPPAHYLTLTPDQVTESGFIESSKHRKELPIFYNQYEICSANTHYSNDDDNARMLFGPLHLTAFMVLHYLKENRWKGAAQVVILSASSKTSLGMAFAFGKAKNHPTIIGLTSKGNIDKLSQLDLYDELYTYGNASRIESSKSTLIIDVSGRTEVLNTLVGHLNEKLIKYIRIGRSNWTAERVPSMMPTEKEEGFFAPSHIKRKQDEWGQEEYDTVTADFIKSSAKKITSWMTYHTHDGLESLLGIHQNMSEGKLAPDKGIIIQLE